jgi:hypothetical protein
LPDGVGAAEVCSQDEMSRRAHPPRQFGAEVRVRDADERLGALSQPQNVAVHHAVLGHDPVHVAAGGHIVT